MILEYTGSKQIFSLARTENYWPLAIGPVFIANLQLAQVFNLSLTHLEYSLYSVLMVFFFNSRSSMSMYRYNHYFLGLHVHVTTVISKDLSQTMAQTYDIMLYIYSPYTMGTVWYYGM